MQTPSRAEQEAALMAPLVALLITVTMYVVAHLDDIAVWLVSP